MKFCCFVIFIATGIGCSYSLLIDELVKSFSNKTASKLLLILTSSFLAAIVTIVIMASLTSEASNWNKLAMTMSGEMQESIDGVFTVDDTTTPGTRTITLLTDIESEAPITDTSLIISDEKKMVLDLNGHIIDRGLSSSKTSVKSETGYVIRVEKGGELTIKDSNVNQIHKFKTITSGENRGLWVLDEHNGDKAVYGGIITGGRDNYGGGICVEDGILNLIAGNIVGNIGINNEDVSNLSSEGCLSFSNAKFAMSGGNAMGNITVSGTIYSKLLEKAND